MMQGQSVTISGQLLNTCILQTMLCVAACCTGTAAEYVHVTDDAVCVCVLYQYSC